MTLFSLYRYKEGYPVYILLNAEMWVFTATRNSSNTKHIPIGRKHVGTCMHIKLNSDSDVRSEYTCKV